MVILSAYIRLAEVGISCPDWPSCYAKLNPEMEKKGVTVLTESAHSVAYYGARVAHRYIASILGLFIVAIFIVALRQGKARATSVLVPLAIFSITVFLSLLGYYTPTRSNPLITMGNLLGGMALLGLLWWLMQRDTGVADIPKSSGRLRLLAIIALCLVVIQIVLGGWSSANYASANCPGLLSCEGNILTGANVADAFDPLRKIHLDASGQVERTDSLGLLSMTHRVFAIFTAGFLAWLVRRLKSVPQPTSGLEGTLLALSLFSIGQVVIGVSMIWLALPLLMLSLHNALAAGLLLSSINLLHRLTPPAESELPATPQPHPSG
jgi:cytochrome c oxidase assembly protein subunit 15